MTRLGVLAIVCLAACKPGTEGAVTSQALAPPSTSSPPLPSAASSIASPPLVEREDIPLGEPCTFRVASASTTEGDMDPAWEARKGQRLVTCHFRVGSKIAPIDVLIATTPGAKGIEALTVGASDGSVREVKFGGGLTLYNSARWELETTDVDFDGVADLRLFSAHGTMGCTYYRHYVFVPDAGDQTRGRYVDAKTEELCNPVLDPRRRVLVGTDVSAGAEKILRWQGDALVDVK